MSSDEGDRLAQDPTRNISVRFCVYTDQCCCYPCCKQTPCGSCCAASYDGATQIVVPDTTTVEEFLRIVTRMNNPKNEYTSVFVNGYQLRPKDLVAPTVRSFEKFESPMVVVPRGAKCCLLV